MMQDRHQTQQQMLPLRPTVNECVRSLSSAPPGLPAKTTVLLA
jgi:hypothetical protein